MKKFTLALAVLATMGLTACSSNNQEDNSYKGTVLYSAYEGENLKLTVKRDNCDGRKEASEETVFVQGYDSDIVVGSCVRVQDDNADNVSRSKSRSWLSRVGIVH